MLGHSFERFYVVTKFILPSISDLKFSPLHLDEKCTYLNHNIVCNHRSKEYISNLKAYCENIVPFIQFYQEQVSSYNCSAHNIVMNEISLILPNFPRDGKEKRGIMTSLMKGFIGLAYEGISSYLHNKSKKPNTSSNGK